MTNSDYKHFVTSAPQKAANILSGYKADYAQTRDDVYLPEAGRLHKFGELHDQALKEAENIASQTELAATITRKELLHKRDAARPKVDATMYQRKADQFRYLLGKGVSLEALVDRVQDDKTGLKVLQDEVDTLAFGENPTDPQAGEGYAARLEQMALDTYGPDYQQADGELKDFDQQAYRAQMAANNVVHRLREDDRSDLSIPDTNGQMIDC